MINRITIFLFAFTMMSCERPVKNCEPSCKNELNSQGEISIEIQLNHSTYNLSTSWIKGPFGNVENTSHLEVKVKKNGHLADLPIGFTLEFFATMPSMGHPMDRAGFFRSINRGTYLNENITFQMPGDWQMHVYVIREQDNEIVAEAMWDFFF